MVFPRMKAMVLAAGLGLRMRPLTLLRAKPVLPVLNRPLLALDADAPARGPGVRDVVVNLHHLPETVSRRPGRRPALRPARSATRASTSILGTGGGPRAVREFFGDEPLPARQRRRAVRHRPARGSWPSHREPRARARRSRCGRNPDALRLLAGGHGSAGPDPLDRRAGRRPRRGAVSRCSRACT